MRKVVKIAIILFVCIILGVILYNTINTKFNYDKSMFNTQKVSRRQLAEPGLKSMATEIRGNSESPIYIIDEFLSPTICENVIKELKSNLEASTLTRDDPTDPYFRTSSTGIFSKTSTQDFVDKKMSDIILAKKSETPQIQHYDISQEFKPHWDGFDPKYDKKFYDKGQRSWTFMIYLNNVEEGGETHFPKLGETIVPKLGRAVIWYNLDKNGDLDRDTLHQGKPIVKGEKYIITKWFN
jgi:prolyl 4-hydroxylase